MLSLDVEDMINISNDVNDVAMLNLALTRQFTMNDLGLLHYFLGIKVASPLKSYVLSQSMYIIDIIDHACLYDNKIVGAPIDTNAQYLFYNGSPLSDLSLYCIIIDSLIYLTIIHLDITYIVHVVR